MPSRHDPTLWFNAPHVVAAYQPVRAPNGMVARYNMAHGGDNRYRATPGVAPAWLSSSGWTFTNASAMWLTTGMIPADNVSVIVRIANAENVSYRCVLSAHIDTPRRLQIYSQMGTGAAGRYGASSAPLLSFVRTGVLAVTRRGFYVNGVCIPFASEPTWGEVTVPIDLGRRSDNLYHFGGDILACMISNATLTPAHVMQLGQQMAYCDVNPDWSVWARRRRYWYRAPVVIESGVARSAGGGAFGAPALPGVPISGHNATALPGYAAAGAVGTIRSNAAAGGHTDIVQRPTAPVAGSRGVRND